MKKGILLTLFIIFSTLVNSQVTVNVSPTLCADPVNGIYIVESDTDVELSVTNDADGTILDGSWSPHGAPLYMSPNQASPYPHISNNGVAIDILYFNTSADNQTYTYTVKNPSPPFPAGPVPFNETITIVTEGFLKKVLCYGDTSTLSDLDILGLPDADLTWYDDAAMTTQLPNTTPMVAGTTYYVDLGFPGCTEVFPVEVDYSTPLPIGDGSQQFCSSNTWLSAGLNKPGDTLADIGICATNPSATLSWYSDANGTQPILTPSNEVLVDGAIYYVSQTINGCESPLLPITVNERECACIKNGNLEDTSLSTYDFFSGSTGSTECSTQYSHMGTPESPGSLDSNLDNIATPVSSGWDSFLLSEPTNPIYLSRTLSLIHI